ncbi:uncharacterized protein METZ01_LOCUS432965 [marine metagenome]|uniref:Uncharacterized protein n=1 Tax=marine metagenome TaxID=408172 RepID=A0A382YB76_9ZZZZ
MKLKRNNGRFLVWVMFASLWWVIGTGYLVLLWEEGEWSVGRVTTEEKFWIIFLSYFPPLLLLGIWKIATWVIGGFKNEKEDVPPNLK